MPLPLFASAVGGAVAIATAYRRSKAAKNGESESEERTNGVSERTEGGESKSEERTNGASERTEGGESESVGPIQKLIGDYSEHYSVSQLAKDICLIAEAIHQQSEDLSAEQFIESELLRLEYKKGLAAKMARIRAERAIRVAARERWVKEGYQEYVGKVAKTSAKGKNEAEEELSQYNKKLENSSIRIINPELKGEKITLEDRIELERIRAEVAIKTAAEEREAKERLRKYIADKRINETLRERREQKESWDRHQEVKKKRTPPVDKGEEVTIVVKEFTIHHTGKREAVGYVRNLRTYVLEIPESLEKGDVITATITHFGGEHKSAGHAIYEETVES